MQAPGYVNIMHLAARFPASHWQCWLYAAAHLAVVTAHAELQHFIKTLTACEKAAQAPKGTAPKAAPTDPLILPITLHFQERNP